MNDNIILIKNSLDFLLQQALNLTEINEYAYHLTFTPKELQKKNAHYLPRELKIELFNLTRTPQELLCTCLSMLATHICCIDGCLEEEDSYNQNLFLLYKASVSLGYFTLKELEDCLDNSSDSDLVELVSEKGEPATWELPVFDVLQQKIVSIKNGYTIKEVLKTEAFDFVSQSQTWEKECVDEKQALRLMKYIQSKTNDKINYSIRDKHTIEFVFYYYLAVSNGYPYRKQLKSKGYVFEGFGYEKSKNWIKKVRSSEYFKEIQSLAIFNGIQYKKVNPKPVKKEKEPKKEVIKEPKRDTVTRFVPIYHD